MNPRSNFSVRGWAADLGPGEFDPAILTKEVVVEAKTGRPRQSGAATAEGQWITDVRLAAERSLYIFAKGILGLDRLTQNLHRPVCAWLQRVPPYRKLYLLPRDHLKTSIARALMLHLLVQPREANAYFPGCWEENCGKPECRRPEHGFDGANTRIMYGAETDRNAEKQLSWAMAKLDGDKKLRAFWPHRVWQNSRKESPKWSAQAIQIPRTRDFPEASIESIGVGGAVTGRHYTVLIKDDLATLKAANSRAVMETTIEWNKATRALMDHPDKSLEFMLGTRWAPGDVWETIQKDDPTVDTITRAILEDGRPIFPEYFSLETIERLRREEGVLFALIRMNNSTDQSIADFPRTMLRYFTFAEGTSIVFDEDERDAVLAAKRDAPVPPVKTAAVSQEFRGRRFTPEVYDTLAARGEYLRMRS